jgi:hypothetical protein
LFVLRTRTLGAFEIGRISDKNYYYRLGFMVWDEQEELFVVNVCYGGACRC